jgi:hypothetical protein
MNGEDLIILIVYLPLEWKAKRATRPEDDDADSR